MDLILNWLWQGVLVAAAATVMARTIPASRSQARYGALWAGLLAVLFIPAAGAVVAVILANWPLNVSAAATVSAAAAPATSPLVPMPAAWWTSVELVVLLWAIWFVLRAVRLGAAIVARDRSKRACLPFDPMLEAQLTHWRRLLPHGRRALLVLSHDVKSASLLGGRQPLIAIAPALVAHLPAPDLDRVVVHEWAHLQRYDDLARIVEMIVDAIAGWHPGIWWLMRQLHIEREAACDSRAVLETGSAKDYARCLAATAALPVRPMQAALSLAMASPGGLADRVQRILSLRDLGRATPWRLTVAAAGLLGAALATMVAGVRAVDIVDTALPMTVLFDRADIFLASSQISGDRLQRVIAELPRAGQAPRTAAAPRGAAAVSVSASASDTQVFLSAPRHLAPINELSIASASVDLPSPLTFAVHEGHEPSRDQNVPVPAPAADAASNRIEHADAAKGDAAAQPSTPSPQADANVNLWSPAVVAGTAIGRASETAATKTAGFFSRFGKRIAGGF